MYTPAPIPQSLVDAIQDPRAPAAVISGLAEALLSDLKYAGWFLEQKSKRDENILLDFLAEYDSAMNACRQAWIAYTDEHSSSAEEGLLQQLKRFREVVHQQISLP